MHDMINEYNLWFIDILFQLFPVKENVKVVGIPHNNYSIHKQPSSF